MAQLRDMLPGTPLTQDLLSPGERSGGGRWVSSRPASSSPSTLVRATPRSQDTASAEGTFPRSKDVMAGGGGVPNVAPAPHVERESVRPWHAAGTKAEQPGLTVPTLVDLLRGRCGSRREA